MSLPENVMGRQPAVDGFGAQVMRGGTIFLVGAAAVAVFVGFTMWNDDPMVVDLPVAQVQEQLSRSTSTWERDGNGTASVRPVGKTTNGVHVQLTLGGGYSGYPCKILLTAQDEETTRMAADCSDPDSQNTAIERVGDEMYEAYVNEHARSVMAGDTYNARRAQSAVRAAVTRDQQAITDEGVQAAH